MNIFNSLGSNYTFAYAVRSVFAKNDSAATAKLTKYLEEKYQGEVSLVYKGREAITLALRLLNLPKGSKVAFNGFTCYAVYQSVKNAGYDAVYIDLPVADLNFTPKALSSALKNDSNIKVVIIQNTLGYPCEIKEIAKICKEKKIILIEDLAHSVGTNYPDGKEAGMVGDFTVLSFSQDKMIDGISGGALIVKNQDYKNRKESFAEVDYQQQETDRMYPLYTFLIRKTYGIGLGKAMHHILKSMRLLSNPMKGGEEGILHTLPNWYSQQIYDQFGKLEKNLAHRKMIAMIYAEQLNKKVLLQKVCKDASNSTNLRFPIVVSDRSDLIQYLKQNGVYVSDIWYDAPVAPKKYIQLTDYHHQCPNAEKVSEGILNLPTHRNISGNQAKQNAQMINKWLTKNYEL